jgi:hypothetical protein
LNNPLGITLPTNITVNGTLTLASGNITTGSHTLSLGASGSVSRTSGHVVGNFRKNVATGATTRTFEIGDANNYTPITVSFGNVTTAGILTASTTIGDHPNIGSSAINPARSVNRYWTLSNSGIIFNSYNAAFTFVPGDLDSGTDPSGFYIAKYDGSWTYPNMGTKSETSTQITGVTSFSDFQSGHFTLAVVPVKMVSFTAEAKQGSAILSWTTANEQMVDHFEIQRSTDGSNFFKIGLEAASNKVQGDRNQFEDRSFSNDAYYRIKTIDLNGNYSYSKILFIKNQVLQTALLVQNSGKNGLVVLNKSAQTGSFRYRLFNMNGSQVVNGNISISANSTTAIPVTGLTQGVYIIELSNKELSYRQKLLIGQ